MSRNNDVFKVLVTNGDQDVLAAGQTLDDLALGQVGFFDAKSNIAIDETSTPPQGFYLAVGVDKSGGGVKDDIECSAGQFIQKDNVELVSYRPHTASQNQIVDISGYGDAKCDCDYSVKFEFRNQEIYRRQGYNQFSKTFSVRTGCCIGTQTVQDGNTITDLLVKAIEADKTGIFTVSAVARQALTTGTHGVAANLAVGDALADGDIAALVAYNISNPTSKVYADVRVELSSLAVSRYCNVNLKYYYPRQTIVITSILEDLVCIGGVVNEVQSVVYEEGNGYDVKQKEYHSQLNAVGPYVLSETTGTAKDNIFYADVAVKYDQTIIESEFKTKSGWQEYSNSIANIVAIPAADTTTRDAFAAVVDALLAGQGFDTLASDVAAADVNPANVEATEDKGRDDDGLA